MSSPTTCASGWSRASRARSAASSLQPAHQDAQTLTTIGLPAKRARSTLAAVIGSVPARLITGPLPTATERAPPVSRAASTPATSTAASKTSAAEPAASRRRLTGLAARGGTPRRRASREAARPSARASRRQPGKAHSERGARVRANPGCREPRHRRCRTDARASLDSRRGEAARSRSCPIGCFVRSLRFPSYDPPRVPERADDRELVERARAGDLDAFRELVRTYERRVASVLYRLLDDPRDVEEATQDVFVQLWRNLHRFRGHAQLFTWLYRIAVNEALMRKRRKRHDLQELDDRLAAAPDPEP